MSEPCVIEKGENGEFSYNKNTHLIVHCTDGKYISIPKSMAAKCSFLQAAGSDEFSEFEYAGTVLENLVRWTNQYGVEGKCDSELVRPCIYRDFSYVAKSEFDAQFYYRIVSLENQRHFLTTMVAAESLGMAGLLDFMSIILGCKLRNEDEDDIMHDFMGLDKEDTIQREDLDKVEAAYPWFKDAVKPTTS